jgi:hypothetical protein
MFNRYTCLILVLISSVFFTQAQERERNIPVTTALQRSGLLHHEHRSEDFAANFSVQRVTRPFSLCSCFVQTQIANVNREGNIWSYQGLPFATCSGEITTRPDQNADTCNVSNLTYLWSVVSGNSVAEISGSNTGSTVNVLIRGNGAFTINLVNTVTCSDGSNCSNSAYYTDTAKACIQCACHIFAAIKPSTGTDSLRGYFGVIDGSCTGNFRKSAVSQGCDSCGPMKNIGYRWSIVAGNDVAEIAGPADQQFVQVHILKAGAYFLQLVGSGQCLDEQRCSGTAVIKDSLGCTGCKCEVSDVTITQGVKVGPFFTYKGSANSSCTGAYRSGPVECVTCTHAIGKEFKWSITSGSDIASINGADNGETVNVLVRNQGKFTLKLLVTITCEDSSQCTGAAIFEEDIPCAGCHCSAKTAITKAIEFDRFHISFFGNVDGDCTGRYLSGADCKPCGVVEIKYKWTISVGNDIAYINGPDDEPQVDVIAFKCGTLVMKLLGTVVCADGSECTEADILELPVGPGCSCGSVVQIQEPVKRANIWTYSSTLHSDCAGEFDPPDCKKCDVAQKKYRWSIGAGNNVAEIVGPANGPTVTVRILKPGDFSIDILGTTVCLDKGECSSDDSRNERVPKAGFCADSSRAQAFPNMNGGLIKHFAGRKNIELGQPVPLGAEGRDFDLLKFFCVPAFFCEATRSEHDVVLNGRVRFEWKIIAGGGGFMKHSEVPSIHATDTGDLVLFRPPDLALPASNQNPTIATATIQLSIIDDNPTGPADPVVRRNIMVTMIRWKTPSNMITVDISSANHSLPVEPPRGIVNGSCRASDPVWHSSMDLTQPHISLPAEAQGKELKTGDWVVLSANDQRDRDVLNMSCAAPQCPGTSFSETHEDNVHWQWLIATPGNSGRLVQAREGRFVAYQAPLHLPGNVDRIRVRIVARALNPTSNMVRDAYSPVGEIELTIFRR